MTPAQFAGEMRAVSPSLPVAATTTEPAAIAASTASCMNDGQVWLPPRLRLMTRAGVAFAGTPGTGSPADHLIASAMSDSDPPHLPSARTGCTRTFHAMPAMPMPLFAVAAATPAMCVPCQLLSPAPSEHALG